jgi:hydroxymethylpyrimidine/phosphomethylpyrimidine kinase
MAEGRVLVIAGSDSGGGAGVQADIKTIMALGGYAASAITVVTVQDTTGVHETWPVPPRIVAAQAKAVLADIGADTIKVGILGEAGEATADLLDEWPNIPLVLDPVMSAKGGSPLASPHAIDLIKTRLMTRAALLTPNAPEAAALTGLAVETTDDLGRAGEALLAAGCQAVLMKGGHVPGEVVVDLLMTSGVETRFESARQRTRHTHGTGCTLASACAVGLAQGLGLTEAVSRARAYVTEAILRAPGYGHGAGPLNHSWPLRVR